MTKTGDGRLVPNQEAPTRGIKLLATLVAEIEAAQR
jgi:hypothetical protein